MAQTEWWPGQPHSPHRDANKVKAIQRSLDWKRVAQIAAYLLQREIIDVPDNLDVYFKKIYEPKKHEPGREWPPKVSKVVGFPRSEFPTFSNRILRFFRRRGLGRGSTARNEVCSADGVRLSPPRLLSE